MGLVSNTMKNGIYSLRTQPKSLKLLDDVHTMTCQTATDPPLAENGFEICDNGNSSGISIDPFLNSDWNGISDTVTFRAFCSNNILCQLYFPCRIIFDNKYISVGIGVGIGTGFDFIVLKYRQ